MKAFIALTLVAFVAAQAPIQVQIPQGVGVQVQLPGNHQGQWQLPEQPPTRPHPRAAWRDPVADSRCPPLGSDDHDGFALILTDPTNANGFRKCWGGWAWPFSCPDGTTFWAAQSVCAFQATIDESFVRAPINNMPNMPNFPNFRPFEADSEEAQE